MSDTQPNDPQVRLLLVDDDSGHVKELSKKLTPIFESIKTFTDTTDAANHIIGGAQYDVMLLAVEMHPVDGLELLKLARHHDRRVQVIMMASSKASSALAIKALKAGAIDYVGKPVKDHEVLVQSIRRALAERNLRIENARLVAELKARNDELNRTVELLRSLNMTSEMMHASRDAVEILNLLVQSARKFLNAERVSIMIRDPKNDEMAVQVAEGLDSAFIKEMRIKPNEGIAGRVIAEGKPIVVNDALADDRVPARDEKAGPYRGKSFMCIPIFLSSETSIQVMGVVNVTDRVDDKPFSEIEVEFVSQLGRQAAYALANAALWRSRGAK